MGARAAAWAVTPQLVVPGARVFTACYAYGPLFHNRHGRGPSFDGGPPNNERGAAAGCRLAYGAHRLFAAWRAAHTDASQWKGSAQSTGPDLPADARSVYAEYSIRAAPGLTCSCRQGYSTEERYLDGDSSDLYDFRQVRQEKSQLRLQLAFATTRARWRVRYDCITERIPAFNETAAGELMYGEAGRKICSWLWLTGRVVLFDAGDVYVSEYEQGWYGVNQSFLITGHHGIRCFLIARVSCGDGVCVWAKFCQTAYHDIDRTAMDYRVQADARF